MVPPAPLAETGRPGPPDAADVRRLAEAWIALDPDPEGRAQVAAWLADGDLASLAERFGQPLRFGTAGLRAAMGPGPARMNRVVVRAASRGVAELVGPGATVVIAHDARHGSATFAADAARVVAAAGGRAVSFAAPVPTPVLAWAVTRLGAAAGIMVTASHNPAVDNGFKVYLADGAQLVAPGDAAVAAHVARWDEPVTLAAPDDPALVEVGDDLVAEYVAAAAAVVTPGGRRDIDLVYTPLHGVAGAVFAAVADAAGFTSVSVVAEQAEPDPDFPTVSYPNPEEAGTLDRAEALARARRASVVLANDPDGDRLGVMLPEGGDTWRMLTGDQIGVLLADHLLRRDAGADRLVVRTFVSSTLLARLAEHHGAHHLEVLTGFKWVAHAALAHPEWRFVFGYEESLGFCVGDLVHEKDGITAAMVFAELVADLAAEGRTPWDRWEELARRFGLHQSANRSIRFEASSAGLAARTAAMDRLRRHPPTSLIGRACRGVVDHLRPNGAPTGPVGPANLVGPSGPVGPAGPADGGGEGGDVLPTADAVALDFGDLRVVVRPSGTEPKLKLYVELVVPVPDGADGYRQAVDDATATLGRAHDALAAVLDADIGGG